jgi:hypothetical protein
MNEPTTDEIRRRSGLKMDTKTEHCVKEKEKEKSAVYTTNTTTGSTYDQGNIQKEYMKRIASNI